MDSKLPFATHHSGLTVAEDEHFDPDKSLALIEYQGPSIPFDLRRVELALFESTLRSPITLLFPKECTEVNLVTDVTMTVELVRAIYEVDPVGAPSRDWYETPNRYLQGLAQFTGPTGEVEAALARVYLATEEDRSIAWAMMQLATTIDRLGPQRTKSDGE
jgi:hypothetical protein